jgi:hypothetical protein
LWVSTLMQTFMSVAEFDHAGVVLEHGQAEVPFSHAITKLFRAALDEGLVEAVDFGRSRFAVLVGNARAENLVLAVLGPGLGQAFQFRVRGVRGQVHGLAGLAHGRVGVVGRDGAQLFQGQSQGVFPAEFHEFLIVHHTYGYDGHQIGGRTCDPRGLRREAGVASPVVGAFDAVALDQIVGQKVYGNAFGLPAAQVARQKIPFGRVYGKVAGSAQNQGQGIAGGAGFVVGHTGAKTYLDDPGCAFGGLERSERGLLQNGVMQGGALKREQDLFFVQAFDGEYRSRARSGDGQIKSGADSARRFRSHAVFEVGGKADFQVREHASSGKRLEHFTFEASSKRFDKYDGRAREYDETTKKKHHASRRPLRVRRAIHV